jgi:hypothetical protein
MIMKKTKALCILVSLVSVLFFLFSTGQAQAETKSDLIKIDTGFRIFTGETWNGNGRTCATCHIPEEAYNIFPQTIKKLNKKQQALVFATNVPGLENIDLVKSHALFNIEGAGQPLCPADEPQCWLTREPPGPIFRSTMTIQALDLTTVNRQTPNSLPSPAGFPGTLKLPPGCSQGLLSGQLPQLGWAGDGSPGTLNFVDLDGDGVNDCQIHHGTFDPDANGTIRAFANGAIAQHSTKSLLRRPGVDFRFATVAELDALEAFQRWLGRRTLTTEENAIQGTVGASEFVLARLNFKDLRVAKGRDHYLGAGQPNTNAPGKPPTPQPFTAANGAGCQACHTNGGAISPIAGINRNINLNTFVEESSELIGVNVVGVSLPLDEGGSIPFARGKDAFNIQSIIEAAEKKAWFHNHKVVENFEEAIAHYGTDDFVNNVAPPGVVSTLELLQNGNGISISFPNGDGINHLGTFLRALNAFYNLRDCERLIDETITRINLGISVENPVRHCLINLSQVQRVLGESKLPGLHKAVQLRTMLISPRLMVAKFRRKVEEFKSIKKLIRSMRDSIAVQTSPLPAGS